ncbi:MAPEG family protein [Xanthomonas hortorum]|uniref:MAPEG family protein n=1 Tax=Xanthomonas hortorum TaxID=56454 RepID=UPI0015D5EDA1|nr:MAPEG family protein [Xanthomonas hortorum]MCE4357785.1 MAPEG family protein [Xanthomonas hortorum pv. taraxaci]NMI52599.1 hypothetical protein [Xanthomonas hortorum pv. taraxaci]CAD0299529.1 hypothetical protein NCPPB940_01800 [Xanthomonas hortorum pv. taraxaci]CAD0299534.1 hypothetical protein NCPPB940_01800 [Xanthomonas hortorum pv. taraxaci]
MSQPLILAMAAHVALTAMLYVLLTVVRAPTVWGIGKSQSGANPWADFEPRISANLSNQFEWPLFFHAACVLLMYLGHGHDGLLLAWIFVAGRALHSGIQILTRNVRLRGAVFTINFLAVLGLWALVVWVAWSPPV